MESLHGKTQEAGEDIIVACSGSSVEELNAAGNGRPLAMQNYLRFRVSVPQQSTIYQYFNFHPTNTSWGHFLLKQTGILSGFEEIKSSGKLCMSQSQLRDKGLISE